MGGSDGAGDEEDGGRDAVAAPEETVREDPRRPRVEEWHLVLTAEGFRASMHRSPGGFAVVVPAPELPAARRALEQWDRESLGAAPAAPEEPPDPILPIDRFLAGVVSLAMLSFFAWTGPRARGVVWFDTGSADGAAILGGELWRTVTALCLHADLGHVASNALFGAVFLAAAAPGYGPGIALALTVAAGAGGNLVNALFHGPDHSVVGASTAVFGSVGLLAARALAARLRRSGTGMRVWVPLAAGLAILSMLGTGERSDFWAHAFGFGTGAFLGVPASLALPRRPAWPFQLAGVGLAAAAVAWAWRLALA